MELTDEVKMERKVERLSRQGTWEEIPFQALTEGDLFKMTEADGTPVDGGQICIADSRPFPTEATFGIQCHPHDGQFGTPADEETMTTENKTPANWPAGLKMADEISKMVTEGLEGLDEGTRLSARKIHPPYMVSDQVTVLWKIGKLVGMTESDLDKALIGK